VETSLRISPRSASRPSCNVASASTVLSATSPTFAASDCSATITLDRYGHLMPGSEDEAAGLLDAYLERADTKARLAAVTADD
jgi:hypothetical protein